MDSAAGLYRAPSPFIRSHGYGDEQNHHQRCPSESFVWEMEQPSWLDDLLKDPEEEDEDRSCFHKVHRRWVSDSYTCGSSGVGRGREKLQHPLPFLRTANEGIENRNQKNILAVDHSKEDQARPSGLNDSKRAKQSRIRKLQYISQLESAADVLKKQGCAMVTELQFVEQQNMLLTMENISLRQRLETISHEHMIKRWEQGMLEREIVRLRALYHPQRQQEMQIHHQMHQQHEYNLQNKLTRNNRAGDFNQQMNNQYLKGKRKQSQ